MYITQSTSSIIRWLWTHIGHRGRRRSGTVATGAARFGCAATLVLATAARTVARTYCTANLISRDAALTLGATKLASVAEPRAVAVGATSLEAGVVAAATAELALALAAFSTADATVTLVAYVSVFAAFLRLPAKTPVPAKRLAFGTTSVFHTFLVQAANSSAAVAADGVVGIIAVWPALDFRLGAAACCVAILVVTAAP